MQLASCQPFGHKDFEVAPRFFKNLWAPLLSCRQYQAIATETTTTTHHKRQHWHCDVPDSNYCIIFVRTFWKPFRPAGCQKWHSKKWNKILIQGCQTQKNTRLSPCPIGSQDSSVSVVTRLDEPKFDSRHGKRKVFFSKTSGPNMGPIQFRVGEKWRVNHSTPSSAKVRNEWRCASIPLHAFKACKETIQLF